MMFGQENQTGKHYCCYDNKQKGYFLVSRFMPKQDE